MKKITFITLLISLFITPTFSFAAADDDQASYGSEVGEKALNGFTNMTTAILELPKNVINTSNDTNIFFGLTGGMFKGLVNTVGRMLVGVIDLITAPIVTKPIVRPAYIWDDFDLDTTYDDAFRLKE